jgi:hypothetical protein
MVSRKLAHDCSIAISELSTIKPKFTSPKLAACFFDIFENCTGFFGQGTEQGAKIAGFGGFVWDCLGIKNPAKPDNLRGCKSV